ncbi:MAG: hypothetical protein KGK11_07755 [Sphingomonadales bacterium]|nr:hypothetical protein [Sphingomonadales bacterium]
MDAALLDARIQAGRAQAAAHLGVMTQVFRPLDALDPLANPVALLPVAFNAADGRYALPSLYGKAVWFADFDARQAEVGDYLVTAAPPFATAAADPRYFFIAGRQVLLPVVAVACNRFCRVTRPAPLAAGSAGATGYGGIDPGAMVDVLGSAAPTNGGLANGWPCSLLLAGSERSDRDPLPSGAALAGGWTVLLPPSVPVAIVAGDRLVDDTGRVLTVEAAELTALGYRLLASEAHD